MASGAVYDFVLAVNCECYLAPNEHVNPEDVFPTQRRKGTKNMKKAAIKGV